MDSEQNEKINNVARKVIDKIPDEHGVVITIITILMIISIVFTLIRIIQECNKVKLRIFTKEQKYAYYGSQIRTRASSRSWFTRRTIRRVIRQNLSRENYSKYGVALMEAILDTAETLTDDEIITIVEAANV